MIAPPSEQHAEIMQFGTSRFLLAHVDYFVSESLAAGRSDKRVVIVQGSSRPEGRRKAHDLAERLQYPVHFRGRREGRTIDAEEWVDSLAACLVADSDWKEIERRFVEEITHVVSNTGEDGYAIPADVDPRHALPASFPARLAKLLHARYARNGRGVTLMPCELIQANGQRLREIVRDLADTRYADPAFVSWLDQECLWIDTLVDRIVSSTIEPVGAVAEPYGLWAIRKSPGLELPCHHPDVQVVSDLAPYEKRKLHVLNLSHSWLVQRWHDQGLASRLSYVREAMQESSLREPLESMLRDEVLPVLDRQLPGLHLEDYIETTLERFSNPFLDHRLEDIAQHHREKLRRRLAPVHEMARAQGHPTPLLESALRSTGIVGQAEAR
ncbi:mannitol dehydrogenase [Halomonas daqiaonensis]|uniref:Tagaturonate reductase n=1 Tax=Halomonas daqiaonensis TaxID=650850 RepID=A0A1H7TS28_9GAMM|nr:mannitol dehydrogenase [Halomonas daqiaonensis]SEL87551.1 tagaturonate reductase [Halomonas daqiaonensis]